ncbi:leucine-rich repeat domain-containing protein [Litchfieldia salsa]|uniref:Leucine-rich repeat domain-containing protein n=1 Tax=Litchfieldia salsa TaxID=930152 RepID=A0A1H0X0D6_9BACI|nr:hypothetical protein [Litchfieldia salsa]SDP96411.1 hypothetical protein SAMN05216565_12140 [Litchfieldia salsa]
MTDDKKYFIDTGEKNSGDCLVLTSYWDESLKDIMLKKEIKNLRLSRFTGWADKDVSFLKTLPFLKGVEVYADDIKDLSAMYDLKSLEYIGLDCNLSFDLDMINFKKLKTLQVKWNKHFKNMFNVSSIESLNIIKYPNEDLVALSNYSNLKKLQLTSTKLKTLKGIDNLINLKAVDLFKCNQLESLESIDHLESLEEFEAENCKKLNNLYQLSNLTNLKTLLIEDCGKIQSIKPLKYCLNLIKVWLGGDTTIIDGNLEVIINLPKLKEFWFVNKKHYNIKVSEVQAILKK